MSFSKEYYKREIIKICDNDIKTGRVGFTEGSVIKKRFIKLIDKSIKDNERITWDEFFSRCGLTV